MERFAIPASAGQNCGGQKPRERPLDEKSCTIRHDGAAGWRAMRLTRLSGDWAVARSAPDAEIPPAVLRATGFVSISRTDDELSVVAPEAAVAGMEVIEPGWSVFKLAGPFAFDEVGIVAGLSRTLAEARIGIFVVSTYDTDYILVKRENAEPAAQAWRATGHEVTD
jgi:hypothetical protein